MLPSVQVMNVKLDYCIVHHFRFREANRVALIAHISEGVDLLGQHIRKYGQSNLLTRPSQQSITSLLRRIRDVIRNSLHIAPGILIWTLNPDDGHDSHKNRRVGIK